MPRRLGGGPGRPASGRGRAARPGEPGSTRFGATQSRGSATRTRTSAPGPTSPVGRPCAARPRRGTDGAGAPRRHVGRLGRVHEVAGGEEPGRGRRAVRRARGTAACRGRSTRPARRASSLSGMKSPVNTTASTATMRSAPSGPADEHAVDTVAPVHAGHRCLASRPAPGGRRASRRSNGAEGLGARQVGDQRHRADACLDAASARRNRRHAPRPTMRARPPRGRCWRWTHCWSWPVVKIPDGRVPGTRRAARGRSRAPVASTTARASTSSNPSGTGHFGPARCRPSRHHGAGPDVHAGVAVARVHPPPGVGRPTQDAAGGRAGRSRCGRTGGGSRRPRPPAPPPATRPAPPAFSAVAAARPAGPAPTTSASTVTTVAAHRRHRRRRHPGCDGRTAEEALTAPVGGPGAAAHPAEVHGGDRGAERVAHLALGDPLAEAHDVAVGRIALDQPVVLEGPRAARSPSSGSEGMAGSCSASDQREPGGSHLRRRRARRWRARRSGRWSGCPRRRRSARRSWTVIW